MGIAGFGLAPRSRPLAAAPGALLLAALMIACTASGVAAQDAGTARPMPIPAPPTFRVQAPDRAFLLAIPPGMCLYPEEVADRYAKLLVDAQLAFLAGECGGVAALLKDGQSIVDQSLAVMVTDSDVDPATRRTEAQLLEGCRAWFPPDASRQDLADGIAALNRSQDVIKADPDLPLGLLGSEPRAVYGGSIGRMARGQDHVLQIKVIACLAPAGVPVLWIFQGIVPPDYPVERIRAEIGILVSAAKSQAAATLALNAADASSRQTVPAH